MVTFTVKDFVYKFSPCINCGSAMSLSYDIIYNDTSFYRNIYHCDNKLEANIINNYSKNINLTLSLNDNSYYSNNMLELNEYLLSQRDLKLKINCPSQCSFAITEKLQFDKNNCFVKPFQIEYISYYFNENSTDKKDMLYDYYYSKHMKESTITLFRESEYLAKLDLPLEKIIYSKSKSDLLNKIKTFITFL